MIRHVGTRTPPNALLQVADTLGAIVVLGSDRAAGPRGHAAATVVSIASLPALEDGTTGPPSWDPKLRPTLGYAPGASEWSIVTRSRWLVVGITTVLDPAVPAFQAQLHRCLSAAFENAEKQRQDLASLQALMSGLGMIGSSDGILAVFTQILRCRDLSDVGVLIRGETGTGKELVARALYRLDPKRSSGPFIPVNCGALSESLAESELLGHREGAFTGARRGRPGLVRAAEGGVLFLDEVGELPLSLQSKLLRVVEERQVRRVGDERAQSVDLRIIAATNRDLPKMIDRGEFRADLYHRLAVLEIPVPPLRERRADIPALINHFLATSRGRALSVGDDFVEAVSRLPLAGNVRQLRNIVTAASLSCRSEGEVGLSDLPLAALQELASVAEVAAEPRGVGSRCDSPNPQRALIRLFEAEGWDFGRCLNQCERTLLSAALDRSRWNRTRAAQLLGVTPRTVYSKLKKHGLQA